MPTPPNTCTDCTYHTPSEHGWCNFYARTQHPHAVPCRFFQGKAPQPTRAEAVMQRLREEVYPQPPQWSLRDQLAIDLMRNDGQVQCRNCVHRNRPCVYYRHCTHPDRPYFQPRQSLMDMQLGRVDTILQRLDTARYEENRPRIG